MSNKLLIVDDNVVYRTKYSKLAKELGLDVIVASGVKEAIKKALAKRPVAIVTDKDMQDGTGNDLAKAVKQVYNPNILGITGGNPDAFDAACVDIRKSKTIDDNVYISLVKMIMSSKDIKKDYAATIDFKKSMFQLLECYVGIDILVQGYDLAKQLQQGKNPLPGFKFNPKLTEDKNIESLFALEDIGIDVYKLRDETNQILQSNNGSASYNAFKKFVEDKDVNEFMNNLAEKDFSNIPYKEFHNKFVELYGSIGDKNE